MFRRNLLAFLCALSMLPVSASFAKSPTIEDGVLLVGTDSSFAPFEFLAEDGKNFTGFDMDLIRAIGKELGYKVVVQNMGFDATVPALRTGIVDAVIAGMTINEKRKKFVDFSDPYYTSGLIIMVRQRNPLKIWKARRSELRSVPPVCSELKKSPVQKWSLLLMLPRLSWNSKTAALTL